MAKNETVYEDMIDILEEYKNYIPYKVTVLNETIPDSDSTEDRVYVTTLVGGDCLSVTHQENIRVDSA